MQSSDNIDRSTCFGLTWSDHVFLKGKFSYLGWCIHWLVICKIAVTLFSRIFTGEETIGYMRYYKTQRSKLRAVTLTGILLCGINVLYSERSLKWLAVCMVSAEMLIAQLQALSTQAAGIKHLYFTWCDEIPNGQPWRNSSQKSVFLRGAECHCQVAKFLLHKV